MAKIKYSALVSEMSGKLNGSVMAKNRSGNYVRTKITPVNPQTPAQVAARNRLSFFSSAWKGLTQGQRDAWNGSVDDWTKTNIFGDSIKPSGQNLYVAVNSNIQNGGGSPLVLPPQKVGVDALSAFSVANDISDLEIELTFAPTPVPANHALVVEATAGMSAGISYMKNKFRQIAVLPATTATGVNVWTQYVAKFGTPTAGQKFGVRCKLINITTGEVSLALSFQDIFNA